MSAEYEESWKHFKKAEANQSPPLTYVLNHCSVKHHRLGDLTGKKGTPWF
jgi:hypothetical protein